MTVHAQVLRIWPDWTLAEIREEEPVTAISLTEPGPGEEPADGNFAVPASAHTVSEEEKPHVESEEALVAIDTMADWGKPMTPDIALVEVDAMMWLQEHPEVWAEYAGQWVALTADGICVAGGDANSVFERAKERGAQDPILFKVSASEGPEFYAND